MLQGLRRREWNEGNSYICQDENQPKGASVKPVCIARYNARVAPLVDDNFNSRSLRATLNVDSFMPRKWPSQTSGLGGACSCNVRAQFEWPEVYIMSFQNSSLRSCIVSPECLWSLCWNGSTISIKKRHSLKSTGRRGPSWNEKRLKAYGKSPLPKTGLTSRQH